MGNKETGRIGIRVPSPNFCWRVICGVFLLLCSCITLSDARISDTRLNTGHQEEGLNQVAVYVEKGVKPLDLMTASQLFKNGAFSNTNLPLSYGIGSRPVWVRFDFNNQTPTALPKRLTVPTSWLDKLDVYFLHDGQVVRDYRVGDTFAHSQRPKQGRYFVFEHDFLPGISEIFIRVETPDPMVVPLYLEDIEEAEAALTLENYSYGFLYGGMFALFAYNLMVYFSLKNIHYLYYSIYITAFLVMNFAYTGHGYMWFWSDAPLWQAWSNPVLIAVFSLCGLLFATGFLNTKEVLPKYHLAIVLISIGFFLTQLLAISLGNQVAALLLSFSLVFVVSILLVLLGGIALLKGNQSAKYFLFGSITHVLSASVTVMVVWGFIPYSSVAYHAVEVGMMVDAIMLAMAMADKFRITQEEKLQAESLSRQDPLTSLNNRRAFYEWVNPIWDMALRKGRPMSVILLDVDKFKVINDRFGHALGDEILVLIAGLVSSEIRPGDVLARWGGEEFVIFLPETNCASGEVIGERLRKEISAIDLPTHFDDLVLTVSLGVAQNDGDNKSLDELISAADKYLYRAKNGGRNQVCSGMLSAISPQVSWVKMEVNK